MALAWTQVGRSGFVVVTVGLLVLAIPGLAREGAAASSDSLDVVTLISIGPGKLFLGGNLIEGPWTLEYDHGRFVVNGYTLPVERSLRSRLDARSQAQLDFIDRGEALAESLRHSDLEVQERIRRLRTFCEASSLEAVVDTFPVGVQLRFASGANMRYLVTSVPATRMVTSPGPPTSPLQARRNSHVARLSQLARWLARGSVVFITNRSGEIVVPRGRAGEFANAIVKMKSGAAPDSAVLARLPRQVRDQIREPLHLDRMR